MSPRDNSIKISTVSGGGQVIVGKGRLLAPASSAPGLQCAAFCFVASRWH